MNKSGFNWKNLRKFGAQFKRQSSSSPGTSLDAFPPRILKEEAKGKEKEVDGLLASELLGSPVSSKTEAVWDKEDKASLAAAGALRGLRSPSRPALAKLAAPMWAS